MGIYQHFRKEEHPFIDLVLSWRTSVERSYQSKLTDFLDPREQQIMKTLIDSSNGEIQTKYYGGGKNAERMRAIIAPFYEEINGQSFQLTLMQASFNQKFISLSHGDVMGAFLSLGVTRDKLGDIFVADGIFQIIMAKEIADYVAVNLTSVKNGRVHLIEKPFSTLLEKEWNWIESEKTVSSLRLDTILRSIYNISRKDATNLVEKKQVKVNFKTVDDGKLPLLEGDLLSVRGKGRSKFVQKEGRTRKKNWRIKVAFLK